MPQAIIILLIPLLPLLGFILLGLFGKKFFKNSSGLIACLLLFAATLLAFYAAYEYFTNAAGLDYPREVVLNYTWLRFSDTLSIDMGLMVDQLSMMMVVVVTFVSLMVHIYSLAYMKGEERFPTYYSFLSLFTFSMLGLVLASNLFQIYIFWELVGVSSFLLIGYYYEKPSAVAACKKAFIVTRFADLGFLIGILVLAGVSDTLDINTMIATVTAPDSSHATQLLTSSFLGISAITWGAVLVFMGGAGKSAMFPLHIWLPDAMEGPTPVSALIHAATMVVAGVFLVARLFPIYALTADVALDIVAYVGVISAVLAAIIACTQTDVKRVLAYSTMSQIGFMMFALGVSGYGGEAGLGYTASQFHLFTHAMFKALLFLGAGVVIHFVHNNDIKEMGGLRKYLPVTHITFLIACLAIAGIPPFAGFFSKEEILLAAYQNNQLIYWLALFTSGLTAYYMFRLYFSIFWNKEVSLQNTHSHSSPAMTIPLVILATGAGLAGFIPFGKYVNSDGRPPESHFDLQFSMLPVAIGLAGIFIAMWLYKKESERPNRIAASLYGLYKVSYNKFYIDEIWLFITKKIVFNLVGRPAAWFDRNVVDGMVNLTGETTEFISDKIKKLQSGKIQQYAIFFLAGAIGLALLFIYVWK